MRGAFNVLYFRCTCELRGCDRREERDQNEISWPRRAIFIEAARALVDGWMYLLNAIRQEEEYARRLFHYLSLFSSTYYFVRSLTFTIRRSHVVHSCTIMGACLKRRATPRYTYYCYYLHPSALGNPNWRAPNLIQFAGTCWL